MRIHRAIHTSYYDGNVRFIENRIIAQEGDREEKDTKEFARSFLAPVSLPSTPLPKHCFLFQQKPNNEKNSHIPNNMR